MPAQVIRCTYNDRNDEGIEMFEYEVGDTIRYTAFGGVEREVIVTSKEKNVKNGRSGFDGKIVGSHEPVWGYDEQIVKVVARV